MTYTEQAIKVTLDNKWNPKNLDVGFEYIKAVFYQEKLEVRFYADKELKSVFMPFSVEEILLDPLFWQALGRGLGWGYDENNTWDNRTWASHWHRLLDYIQEGKTIEDYFKELLTK